MRNWGRIPTVTVDPLAEPEGPQCPDCERFEGEGCLCLRDFFAADGEGDEDWGWE